MKRICLLLILFIAISSQAEMVEVNNVRYRKLNNNITIYMDINNNSDQLLYLLGAQIEKEPNFTFKISKTVIDNNIAKIIEINRLVIPAKAKVSLAPLGIYLVVKNVKVNKKSTIDLLFQSNEKSFVLKINEVSIN